MDKTENKIKVLPENLINKIAAGEVIDRPSSVLKELVENSIDAGADRITILLKNGGKSLIQIIDNGMGMEEEDAIMSLQRHATSKIRTYRDVENIRSLGFRGEALASIASISRLEMKTVRDGKMEGSSLLIEGGVVQKVDRTGGNSGTSIAVKNLFYNTPARRKFLRADQTEYRHILSVLNRFTLCYPEIGFNLVNEDNEVFNYKPTTSEERVSAVLGGRVQNNLITVKDETGVATITGFIGNFEAMRKSRNDQYIFLNRRYIVDRTINYAISSAFGEHIPKGSYPLYVLFFEIDPERLDVNVHPTKTEVRFVDQQMLYSIVRGAIKRALTNEEVIPQIDTKPQPSLNEMRHRFQASLAEDMRSFSTDQMTIDFDRPVSPEENAKEGEPETRPVSPFSISPAPSQNQQPAQEVAMVWQLHNKYILSQIKSGLVVIDQHVAHERILYERAKKSFSQKQGASQQLLFPETIELSAEDFDYLTEVLPFLEKLGFIIKSFGGRTVVVEGIPSGMRIGSENKMLLDILDEYKKNLTTEFDIRERLAKSFSCRSAIMSGEKLTPEAMNSLIDQLFTTENPYFCPHGRPVMVTISIDELDKRFDRK